ncbi:MAG: hypothetical protein M1511_15015, partial [Deltaproteobacteria bacterium]|nr:hypothetical protein [Deltaproteobacteria bacterium]
MNNQDNRRAFEKVVRSPENISLGRTTAVGTNIEYRLGLLDFQEILQGLWLDCGCAEGGYSVALTKDWFIKVVGLKVMDSHDAGIFISPGSDHNIIRNIEATDVG